MPNHQTHDKIGLLLTPAVIAGTIALDMEVNHAIILTTSYVFSTLYITPDLDTDSKPYHRWGILRFIWYPYKKLIPHRSFLSHSTILSGTIRFVYLALILWGILYTLGYSVKELLTLSSYYVIIWISIVLVDTIHVFLDTLWKDT